MAQNPPTAPKGKSLSDTLKKNKTELLVGAAGLVGVIALYLRSKSSSSTGATTAATGTPSSVVYLPTTSGGGEVGSPSSVTASAAQPVSVASASPSSPAGPVPSYVALGTRTALNADLSGNTPVFQSPTEAAAWDTAHGTPAGQSVPGPGTPYSALSPAAAQNLFGSGQPVYVKQA